MQTDLNTRESSTIQHMLRLRLSVETRRRLLSLGKSICFGSFCACHFSLIFSLDLVVSHTRANRSARASCYVCSVRNSTTNSIDSKRLSILIKFLVTNLSFSCTVSFLLFFPFFSSASSAFHPFFLSFFHSFILSFFGYEIRTLRLIFTQYRRGARTHAMENVMQDRKWFCCRAQPSIRF